MSDIIQKNNNTFIPLSSLIGTGKNKIQPQAGRAGSKKLYVETYGCQMNFADTEIVNGVMSRHGYLTTDIIEDLIDTGEKGIAVRLSKVETYDDIVPLRKEGISAWLSIMRGCDKFCSFCVVPYTRGRERSRTLHGVVEEVKQLWLDGFKEVTL